MEHRSIRVRIEQIFDRTPNLAGRGFAVVACTALIPLLLAAFAAMVAGIAVLQKKSLAQSVCVRTASQLGDELGHLLSELMRLNPSARRLTRQRVRAEHLVRVARASRSPPLVAAAEAQLRAVQLAQIALATRQRAILLRARATRLRWRGEFGGAAARIAARARRPTSGDGRALAVEARPPTGLTPEYEPVADFARRQRQVFAMDVALAPRFARPLIGPSIQRTTCITTLRRKEPHAWTNQITAASAPSNWR